MKYPLAALLLFFLSGGIFAQEVTAKRTSALQKEGYAITGSVVIEELSDGKLKLSLTEDYSTQSGPDVHMLLATSKSVDGAFDVVNLTAINHWSGAMTFDLPDSITLDQYAYVLLHCVRFNEPWASGKLGEVEQVTTTATKDASLTSQVSIFPNPASDVASITWPATFQPHSADVFSVLGRNVSTQRITSNAVNTELDVRHFVAGRYLVRLSDGQRTVTRLLLVRH
ncbi:T9SS type A sorting domain-containing protein [Neolewinella antarctica]|uniref:DM13 domain-containing protein n=1 Tax=Neolewinella antarctica TaxID=442734 RepID=A0ABX0X746_9BACT|nr:T9SS type A sorting domain-containing protein [Neolewinella antarctica]NJC25047.1 hypothetical protein [Neolewinella antarctica]